MSWLEAGFERFPAEPAVLAWVASVRAAALQAAADAEQRAAWLRHGGTWFVGVDALPNDSAGAVAAGPGLSGVAYRQAAASGVGQLHRAQVSVVGPGYPGPDPGGAGAAAHRFRLHRDAAHLDGVPAEGPDRRRHLREPHGWILGVGLSRADAGAAPLVAWRGSHLVIRRAFAAAFSGIAPARWGEVDVTDIYNAARAEVFETCRRVELPLAPGETVLLHRMTIHGIAPWREQARAAPEGRMTAYFRPCFEDPAEWLARP